MLVQYLLIANSSLHTYSKLSDSIYLWKLGYPVLAFPYILQGVKLACVQPKFDVAYLLGSSIHQDFDPTIDHACLLPKESSCQICKFFNIERNVRNLKNVPSNCSSNFCDHSLERCHRLSRKAEIFSLGTSSWEICCIYTKNGLQILVLNKRIQIQCNWPC